MRAALLLAAALALAGCEEPRARGGATPDSGRVTVDAAAEDDAAVDASDADAGAQEAGGSDSGARDSGTSDMGIVDTGTTDAGFADSGATDAGFPDTGIPPDSGPSAICGDGRLDPGETCDDGVISSGCDTAHDGGDGTCLPPGQCASGYVLDGNGDCLPSQVDATVIIDVDNFCNMNVTPAEITVPAGQTILVDWYNRSRDYAVDIWLSYGGGYLDLPTGATWDEPIPHCTGPNPHTEYADVSTACSSFRFYFRCQ